MFLGIEILQRAVSFDLGESSLGFIDYALERYRCAADQWLFLFTGVFVARHRSWSALVRSPEMNDVIGPGI